MSERLVEEEKRKKEIEKKKAEEKAMAELIMQEKKLPYYPGGHTYVTTDKETGEKIFLKLNPDHTGTADFGSNIDHLTWSISGKSLTVILDAMGLGWRFPYEYEINSNGTILTNKKNRKDVLKRVK